MDQVYLIIKTYKGLITGINHVMLSWDLAESTTKELNDLKADDDVEYVVSVRHLDKRVLENTDRMSVYPQ